MKKVLYSVLTTLIIAFSQGCVINYGAFPEAQLHNPPQPVRQDTLHYRLEGRTLFGGYDKLRALLKSNTPFNMTEQTTNFDKNGYFVDIKVKTVAPSAPALVFGYISASFLTLTPFWSTRDGYEVFYELYKDGTKLKTFSYEIKRKSFFWIVMIPFSIANFSTYSEEDAFQGVTYQFFEDAKPFLQ